MMIVALANFEDGDVGRGDDGDEGRLVVESDTAERIHWIFIMTSDDCKVVVAVSLHKRFKKC